MNYIFKLSEQDQQQSYERRVTVMPTMFLDDPNQNSLIDQADLEVIIIFIIRLNDRFIFWQMVMVSIIHSSHL